MKKILSFALFAFFTVAAFAQTDGITYQAIIISPNIQEIPGVDVVGNILPETRIAIRFTILDENNAVEYQEVQATKTDQYGGISLLIGASDPDGFKRIKWNGTSKNLKVEIDFTGGTSYVDLSREQLTFLPFALHRNIKATGTLTVDDDSFLNGELTVELPTNLNSTLSVNNKNASDLTGSLTVGGDTNLESLLNVNNQSTTSLSGVLNVGEDKGIEDKVAKTVLNGTLNVVGLTTVHNFVSTGKSNFNELIARTLKVNEETTLNGKLLVTSKEQVKITSTLKGGESSIDNYPLLVEGGTQGIAIKSASINSKNENNYIAFFSSDNKMQGRVEGETKTEMYVDLDYKYELRQRDFDTVSAAIDLAFSTFELAMSVVNTIGSGASTTACAGLGAVVCSPIPSLIGASIAEAIAAAILEAFTIAKVLISADWRQDWVDKMDNSIGVTYQSASGDYAEYLVRANINEELSFGDIVGVKGGKISKNTIGAEKMMVVSFKPIVLGNMPQANREKEYEKVAFMGQVPVKVFGKVNIGDYIVPRGYNDGTGIAIEPSKMNAKDINNIVGVAWEKAGNNGSFNMINVVVGLNVNDNNFLVEKLEKQVSNQAVEINELKQQITEIMNRLVQGDKYVEKAHNEHVSTQEGSIAYYEITQEDIEAGFKLAEETVFKDWGNKIDPSFFEKIKVDAKFKADLLSKLQVKLKNALHIHKAINEKENH
jgi:hypothetical protein